MDYADEIGVAASVAAHESDFADRMLDRLWQKWWPRWRRGNAHRRLLNQLQPQDDANPLQVRLLIEVLLDNRCEEVWDLLDEVRREGRARAAERDRDQLIAELDRERRRPRRVEPRDRQRGVA